MVDWVPLVRCGEFGEGPRHDKDDNVADPYETAAFSCAVCCRMPLTGLEAKDGDMTANRRRHDAIVAVTRVDPLGKPI